MRTTFDVEGREILEEDLSSPVNASALSLSLLLGKLVNKGTITPIEGLAYAQEVGQMMNRLRAGETLILPMTENKLIRAAQPAPTQEKETER